MAEKKPIKSQNQKKNTQEEKLVRKINYFAGSLIAI